MSMNSQKLGVPELTATRMMSAPMSALIPARARLTTVSIPNRSTMLPLISAARPNSAPTPPNTNGNRLSRSKMLETISSMLAT